MNVNVYLENNISQAQTDNIFNILKSMPQVSSVTYRSQAEAYQVFLKEFSNQPDMTANVSPDALPASLRVDLKDPQQFEQVRVRVLRAALLRPRQRMTAHKGNAGRQRAFHLANDI